MELKASMPLYMKSRLEYQNKATYVKATYAIRITKMQKHENEVISWKRGCEPSIDLQ